MRTTMRLLVLATALLLTLLPERATGQTVRGRVTEMESGEPVARARIALLHGTGRRAATAQTDDDGRFAIAAPGPGEFLLEASAPGFTDMAAVAVGLAAQEAVLVTLTLSRQVIALEPLVVTGRRYDHRHDATWLGALARRDIHGRFGNQRVFMQEDLEMRTSTSVVDVVRGVPPPLRGSMLRTLRDPLEDGPRRTRGGCNVVFLDGGLLPTPEEALWALDTPPAHFEAVEIYRRWHDAPQGLRTLPMYAQGAPGNCSVVALWSRTGTHPDDPARSGRFWIRSLAAVGVMVLMILVVPSAL